MICPQCGKRNDLGIQQCRYCRRPFTRQASRMQTAARSIPGQPAWETAAPRAASSGFDARPGYGSTTAAPGYSDTAPARYATRPEQPYQSKRRNGCLIALGIASVAIVGMLVLLLLTATMVVQPMIRDAAVDEVRQGVRHEVSRQITTQFGEAPAGEIVLSEAELNQRLAGESDLGPISSVNVRITSDGLVVNLRAYGVDGTYRAQVHSENGSVRLVGSPMEGALGLLVPEGDLEDAVNSEIALALSDAGYYVDDVTMTDGALILRMAQ
jgi:hypothetical protein